MKIGKSLILLIPLAVCQASAASAFAIDVNSDFDSATDFGRYKTFCWQKVETRNPLRIERIKTAVNSALTAKVWSQAESSSACDVAVVTMAIKRNHDTVNTFYDSFGGGWGGRAWRGFGADGFGESTTTTETYKTGTLIVDLFYAKSESLVWRGSATDTLSNEHFPPQSKN